jgi:hypothetical protein
MLHTGNFYAYDPVPNMEDVEEKIFFNTQFVLEIIRDLIILILSFLYLQTDVQWGLWYTITGVNGILVAARIFIVTEVLVKTKFIHDQRNKYIYQSKCDIAEWLENVLLLYVFIGICEICTEGTPGENTIIILSVPICTTVLLYINTPRTYNYEKEFNEFQKMMPQAEKQIEMKRWYTFLFRIVAGLFLIVMVYIRKKNMSLYAFFYICLFPLKWVPVKIWDYTLSQSGKNNDFDHYDLCRKLTYCLFYTGLYVSHVIIYYRYTSIISIK